MPVEVVSYLFSGEDIKSRLQSQIILQCAPFLKGIKVACITNIDGRYCRELESVLGGTDIEYKVLTVKAGKCLVIFYRRKELADYFRKKEVRDFLGHYGYVCQDLEQVLCRLSKRVSEYSCREDGFPHEIGAFLDYPIGDVKCFIEQGGKGEILTGYWKVYSDPVRARMTFLAYDKARISAVNEFLTGKTIRDIACRAA